MNLRSMPFVLLCAATSLFLSVERAQAFCGAFEETRTANTVDVAKRKAENAAIRKLRELRGQYGKKLVKDKPQIACVGGALSITKKGKQIEGDASCTITQPFCVNP